MGARSRWLIPLALGLSGFGAAQELSLAEVVARGVALLERLPDGLVLLHARTGDPPLGAHGFRQDASSLYLTGHEILSTGLSYSASEIAGLMASR